MKRAARFSRSACFVLGVALALVRDAKEAATPLSATRADATRIEVRIRGTWWKPPRLADEQIARGTENLIDRDMDGEAPDLLAVE